MSMTKKSKLSLLSLLGIASVAAGGVALWTTMKPHESSHSVSIDSSTTSNELDSSNLGNNSSNLGSISNIDRDSVTGEKPTLPTVDETLNKEYKINLLKNDNKEGTIFLADKDGNITTDDTVKPGESFYVGVQLNKGFEAYTLRDLIVYGASSSYMIPSKSVEGKINLFEVKMPTVEDQKMMDGTDTIYGENVEISVIPSFIKESIGVGSGVVNWEHGTYYEVHNGYVYNLESDANWSELKDNLYETYDNSSPEKKQNPIHIFFYLRGHTLTIDEDIDQGKMSPNFFPEGWTVHFLNNETDTATPDGKYGKITASDPEGFNVKVKGGIGWGRSVYSNYIPYRDGIKILQHDNDNGWNTTIKNDPTQQ